VAHRANGHRREKQSLLDERRRRSPANRRVMPPPANSSRPIGVASASWDHGFPGIPPYLLLRHSAQHNRPERNSANQTPVASQSGPDGRHPSRTSGPSSGTGFWETAGAGGPIIGPGVGLRSVPEPNQEGTPCSPGSPGRSR
jgi:hypothetical protein